MKVRSYRTGILFKLLAIVLVVASLLVFLGSSDFSQQTGQQVELYWIASWIIFIVGLVAFATGVMIQRSALRELRAAT